MTQTPSPFPVQPTPVVWTVRVQPDQSYLDALAAIAKAISDNTAKLDQLGRLLAGSAALNPTPNKPREWPPK